MPTPLLIEAIQLLARARCLDDVTGVIRATARTLVGADGVTFVMRDGGCCHYIDEDAIGPLWKGNRYPLESCITGWVMLNRRPTVIPDIYLDDRIPHAAYRPTFVKSLAAVPIRSSDPIGAIGAYWARTHEATEAEVSTLQILADASAIALENVRLLADLASANDAAVRQSDEIRSGAERLRDALDAGKMSTWEWDLTTGQVTGSGGHSPFGNGERSDQPVVIASLNERVHADDRDGLDDAVRRSRSDGGTFEHEFRVVRTDGDTRWVRGTGRVLDGDHPRIAGVLQDITEHRGLVLELARAQKIESIGRLAGGVAHDFNNALTAIIGSVELAKQQEGPLPDAVEAAFISIETAAQHAASLTRQLLTFARKQVLEPKVINLNDLVTTATSMISRLLTENIVVRTTLAPELWRVRVDPEQVVQVIVNLAVNARDAMPRGGRLTFATSNVDISSRDAHHHPGINPGRYVMMSVRDTGVGMDQTVQKYIFEPFFTTKGAGQGTGLGLATVHGIVKQHGGHIWVYSEPGMGTIFKIFFPESRDSVVEVKATESRPALSHGSGTILLVEDEPLVRNIAALTLRAAGYHVIEAADGATAIQTARELQRGPDVLVTDIVMPGMSGTEVAESLTRLFPSLRTIFTSGYSEESALAPGSLGPRTAFLPKPYTLSSLSRAVQDILQPHTPAEQ